MKLQRSAYLLQDAAADNSSQDWCCDHLTASFTIGECSHPASSSAISLSRCFCLASFASLDARKAAVSPHACCQFPICIICVPLHCFACHLGPWRLQSHLIRCRALRITAVAGVPASSGSLFSDAFLFRSGSVKAIINPLPAIIKVNYHAREHMSAIGG